MRASLKKVADNFFQSFIMCEKARQSRVLLTRGTALHAISRGSRPAGSLEAALLALISL
jgi:hypothetical protein